MARSIQVAGGVRTAHIARVFAGLLQVRVGLLPNAGTGLFDDRPLRGYLADRESNGVRY